VRRLSLRSRLVLGLLVVAAAGLMAADVATYTSLRSFLFQQTDQTLEADHHFADQQGRGVLPPGLFVQIQTLNGQVLASSLGHAPRTSAPPPPKLPTRITLAAPTASQPDAVRYLTVPARSGGGRYRVRASIDPGSNLLLIVGLSLHDVDATLHRLFLIELIVTAAVLAGLVLLGLWTVCLGLRPLEAIGRTADAIAAGDLSKRVERAEGRTEVGRLGLALNAMLGRIEESDRRLRRFVADASHELRTPLTAVRAYAELFTRGADQRPGDLARAMGGIERESERMSILVEDLLLLARLDEGRPLDRQPVQLDEVVEEAVETARTVEPERPIQLDAEPARVLGDRERLRQVVDNLLSNVRVHTPDSTPVRVSVARHNGRAVVEVADPGPGMPADEAARVFERFYRADPSRARDRGGVGLGLSIVAAIADAHGGSASASSEPGKGSAFRISLPLLDEH
jgi:two-component system, OmpR family, sensor kinase